MTTSAPTIAEQVADLEAGLAPQLPPAALQAFATEQAGLAAGGLPGGLRDVGTPMPDADLLHVDGQPTTRQAARPGRPAAVPLHRGGWGPACKPPPRAPPA